jgi:hypothetical protein
VAQNEPTGVEIYNVKKYWEVTGEYWLRSCPERKKSSDGIAKLDVLDFVENIFLWGLRDVVYTNFHSSLYASDNRGIPCSVQLQALCTLCLSLHCRFIPQKVSRSSRIGAESEGDSEDKTPPLMSAFRHRRFRMLASHLAHLSRPGPCEYGPYTTRQHRI